MMRLYISPVRPELVEGRHFFCVEEKRHFDKLSANGIRESAA
jgi:hypothetical protein